MKSKRKVKEKPKTFKWYLDKILIAVVSVIVITGVALWIVAAMKGNMIIMFVGIAMLPAAGILITPNIVLCAFKDNKGWKSKFREERDKLYKGGMLRPVGDMSPYYNKLVLGVRREALWNLFKLMLVLIVPIAARFINFISGGSADEGVDLLSILAVLTFGIPISAYNIASSAYRIRTVKRREYNAYRTVVNFADGLTIGIIDKKDNIHRFGYCRCLGIRSKEVLDTKAILVFVPDEVYLLPDKE